MSTEDDKWREKFSQKMAAGNREGYRPQGIDAKQTRSNGRTMRPRINRSVYSTSPTDSVNYSAKPTRSRIASNNHFHDDYAYENSSRLSYSNTRNDNNAYSAFRREQRPYGVGAQERNSFARADKKSFSNSTNQAKKKKSANYNPNAKYSMKKQIEYKQTHIDLDAPIRLNRFLANAGVCSRREADFFITAGVVSVNGVVVTELGTKILRTDSVMFHDQLVSMEKKVYILLNKPKDYVTTVDDPKKRKTVMDLVKGACNERIYPVGRLDRNTTGVLLLTNDGDLATKLTHPKNLKKKIYHVFCDKNVTAGDMQRIAEGIQLSDGEIYADHIEYASPTDKKQVGIEIHSGRNRIVRRIFEHLGYRVVKLDRVLFAGLTKKNVKRGDWRFLTEKEVSMLQMGAFE